MSSAVKVAMHSVVHRPSLRASMNSVSPRRSRKLAIFLVAGKEPEADRNLRGVEELARQRHHAVDQVRLDDRLADLALTRLLEDIEPLASTKPASP